MNMRYFYFWRHGISHPLFLVVIFVLLEITNDSCFSMKNLRIILEIYYSKILIAGDIEHFRSK